MRLPKRQTWTIIICWTIRNSGFFCTAKLQQLLYSSKVTSKDWCTTTPGTNSTLSQLPELELTECRQIDWVIKVGFHSFIGEMEDGMYTCLPWQLQQGFTSLADLFRKKGSTLAVPSPFIPLNSVGLMHTTNFSPMNVHEIAHIDEVSINERHPRHQRQILKKGNNLLLVQVIHSSHMLTDLKCIELKITHLLLFLFVTN